MFAPRISSIVSTVIASGALGLAAFAGIATASAGSVDDAYLDNISAEGISYDSPDGAIRGAYTVCDMLASGETGVDVANEILDVTDLTKRQAVVVVVESVNAYCPELSDQLTA